MSLIRTTVFITEAQQNYFKSQKKTFNQSEFIRKAIDERIAKCR